MAAPAAPSDLHVTGVTGDQISLAWTDNATDEDGYRVYRSRDEGQTWTQDGADLAANTVSYTTTALLDGERYWFRVCAFNVDGESCDDGGLT